METPRNCNKPGQNRSYPGQPSPQIRSQMTYKGQGCREQIQPRTPSGINHPIGMAYIPYQEFENLYDAKCGLMEGTMFKDLNLIFCGVRGNQL